MAEIDPMAALKAILEQMTENQTAQLKEFAAELKKPTALEQKKLDEENARLLRTQNERIELAKVEERRKETARINCGHVRWNPITGAAKHLWVGQVCEPAGKPAYWVATCQGCQTQVGPIPATPDMFREGVELHRRNTNYDELIRASQAYRPNG